MASKTAFNKAKHGRSIRTATDVFLDEIVAAYGTTVRPVLKEGEEPADVGLLIRQVGRVIDWHGDRVRATDRAHIDEKSDDIAVYIERDAAEASMRGYMVFASGYCRNIFGAKEAAKIIVAEEGLAASPKELLEQAAHTLERLSDPECRPPKRRLDVKFDREGLKKGLEPKVKRLAAATRKLEREQREADTSLSAKNEALAAHQAVYGPGVKMYEGMFAFVGKLHLADRVRPVTPRRRKSAKSEPDPAPATEAPTSVENPPPSPSS